MVERLVVAASDVGSAFYAEAGESLGTPQHPLLGMSLYLLSTFALGILLSEAWRACGPLMA